MKKRKLILYLILLAFCLITVSISYLDNKMSLNVGNIVLLILLYICIILISSDRQFNILSILSLFTLMILVLYSTEWNNIKSHNQIYLIFAFTFLIILNYIIINKKDKKFNEEENKKINKYTQSIFNQLNGFVFAVNKELIILEQNKYAESALKYNDTELKNTSILSLFSQKVHKEILEMVTKKEIISKHPLYIFKKNGRTIPIVINSILENASNNSILYIYANRFISSIHSENKTSCDKSLYKEVFIQNSRMQILISRDNYQIVKINKILAEHLHISMGTLVGKYLNNVFENSEEIADNIDRNSAFKKDNIRIIQNQNEYSVFGSPVKCEKEYFIIYIEEYSLRKSKDAELINKEKNYAYQLFIKTIDSITDQVYIIDCNYKIKLTNKSANQFCKSNKINNNIGKSIFETFNFMKKEESNIKSIMLNENSLNTNKTIKLNGKRIAIKIKYCPVYMEDSILNIMIIINKVLKENYKHQPLLCLKDEKKIFPVNNSFIIWFQDNNGEKRWVQNSEFQITEYKNKEWRIIGIDNEINSKMQKQYKLLNINEKPNIITCKKKDETSKEINSQNKLEETLRESQKIFRCYFELGPLGMAISSPNTNWLQVNKTLRVMLGYTELELLSMTWTEITHPDDYSDEMNKFLKVLNCEISGYQHRKRFINKDGEIIYTMISVKGMYHSNNSIKNVLMLIQDITEISKTREKLAKKLEFEKGLANCSRILLREDIPPEQAINETLKMLQSTIEISRIFIHENYDDNDENLCNRLVYEVCAAEVKSELQNPQKLHLSYEHGFNRWKLLMLQKQILNCLVENLPQNEQEYFKSRKIKSILVIPLYLTNNWIGFIGFENILLNKDWNNDEIAMLHTVTDMIVAYIGRKKTEIKLENEKALLAKRVADRTKELSRANAQLAKAAKLKDEFIASMSHELRTPLNAILGLSEALVDQVYGPLNADHIKTLNTVGESGRHLLELINDILDLSKIGAGNFKLEINNVNISSICELSLRFVHQQCVNKHIKIETKYDETVKIIKADERRLKQILVNLLSNAIKFSPNESKIILTVEGDEEKQIVKFIVSDYGIGIAEDEMDNLFKPFVQLDSSLSRKHGGTGLGLSLVRKLVEMHGGSISVESQLNKGSTFIISLPWHECNELTDSLPLSKDDEKVLSNIGRIIIYSNINASSSKLNTYFKKWDLKDIEYVYNKEEFKVALTTKPEIMIYDYDKDDEEMHRLLNDAELILEKQNVNTIFITDNKIDTSRINSKLGKMLNIVRPINQEILLHAMKEIAIVDNKLYESNALSGVKKMHPNQQSVIMLAEDNEYNINMIYDYLTAKNYLVIVARNGKEAISLMHETKPDLILMDIQMPEMDGIEAMEVIRQNDSFHEIPIIALTALAMPGDRERCLAAGANDYLTKPVRLKILIKTIDNFINKKENVHEM